MVCSSGADVPGLGPLALPLAAARQRQWGRGSLMSPRNRIMGMMQLTVTTTLLCHSQSQSHRSGSRLAVPSTPHEDWCSGGYPTPFHRFFKTTPKPSKHQNG